MQGTESDIFSVDFEREGAQCSSMLLEETLQVWHFTLKDAKPPYLMAMPTALQRRVLFEFKS